MSARLLPFNRNMRGVNLNRYLEFLTVVSVSNQARRQDFEWDGALRILMRSKLAKICQRHAPNWQIGGAPEVQVGC